MFDFYLGLSIFLNLEWHVKAISVRTLLLDFPIVKNNLSCTTIASGMMMWKTGNVKPANVYFPLKFSLQLIKLAIRT